MLEAKEYHHFNKLSQLVVVLINKTIIHEQPTVLTEGHACYIVNVCDVIGEQVQKACIEESLRVTDVGIDGFKWKLVTRLMSTTN